MKEDRESGAPAPEAAASDAEAAALGSPLNLHKELKSDVRMDNAIDWDRRRERVDAIDREIAERDASSAHAFAIIDGKTGDSR